MDFRETKAWAELTAPQKVAVLTYMAAEYAFLLALPLAFLTAAADARAGGYILIVALTIHFVGKQLAISVFADQQGDVERPLRERRVALAGDGFTLALIVGLFGALAGWDAGAYVAVAALIGLLASHLALGGLAYRRVMARRWPDVPPPADDDDW